MKIPLVDLKIQYENLKGEVLAEVEEVFSSTQFILGEKVSEFEQEFASFNETEYCVGVASGTDALHLALKAVGIGPGDEVITAANTFVATVLAIVYAGAKPVLVDIDEHTFNMDISKIEQKINSKTKAIIPVHLYGRVMDMDALMSLADRHEIHVIEDACQAHGARWKGKFAGTWGLMGCFSFYPGKNLGAFGDGGALTTSSKEVYECLKKLRNYGSTKKYIHDSLGWNSRLDTVQAAILNIKLKRLQHWNNCRWERASNYDQQLRGVGDLCLPEVPEMGSHVFHLYVIRTKKRDALLKFLNDKGVQAGIHYPYPINAQQAFKDIFVDEDDCHVAKRIAEEIFSLPLFPELTETQQTYVVESIKEFYVN